MGKRVLQDSEFNERKYFIFNALIAEFSLITFAAKVTSLRTSGAISIHIYLFTTALYHDVQSIVSVTTQFISGFASY